MIKLLRFDGIWIISELEEIPETEFGDPDCILKYPYSVEDRELLPWPVHTDERELVVRSSNITILSEPKKFLLARYASFVHSERSNIIDDEIIEETDTE